MTNCIGYIASSSICSGDQGNHAASITTAGSNGENKQNFSCLDILLCVSMSIILVPLLLTSLLFLWFSNRSLCVLNIIMSIGCVIPKDWSDGAKLLIYLPIYLLSMPFFLVTGVFCLCALICNLGNIGDKTITSYIKTMLSDIGVAVLDWPRQCCNYLIKKIQQSSGQEILGIASRCLLHIGTVQMIVGLICGYLPVAALLPVAILALLSLSSIVYDKYDFFATCFNGDNNSISAISVRGNLR